MYEACGGPSAAAGPSPAAAPLKRPGEVVLALLAQPFVELRLAAYRCRGRGEAGRGGVQGGGGRLGGAGAGEGEGFSLALPGFGYAGVWFCQGWG